MEALVSLMYLVGIFFIAAPFILIIGWVRWRKRLHHLTEQVAYLTARVQDLEEHITNLRAPVPGPERLAEGPPEPARAPIVPSVETAESVSQAIPGRQVVLHTEPSRPTSTERPAAIERPPAPAPTPAATTRERFLSAVKEKRGDGSDWESVIGGKWLNKIGVVVLVIGVALFLGYSLRYLGPVGRVLTGVVTSLVLLAGGVALERIERYTGFAKPLIGGGWALLYFTAYAAHNLDAAKIIHEPLVGLTLLSLIAAGMILHSLKYQSQMITGLAYFLGFLTVALSPLTGFTLAASAILAASIAILFRSTRWYFLGFFVMAATYLNHFLWLEFRMGGSTRLSPDGSFWLAEGMLVLYWLLFTAFDFLLKPETEREENAGLAINATNTAAFVGLSLQQVGIVFPDARYLLTGSIALAYIATSAVLRMRERRQLYLVNASVAIVLVALTAFLKLPSSPLTHHWLAIAWLGEAAAVLSLGLYRGEFVFRALAYLLSLCGLGALVSINLYGPSDLSHMSRWATVLPAVAYFYWPLWGLRATPDDGRIVAEEKHVGPVFSSIASALLIILLWKELPPVPVALAWGFVGFILVEAGIRTEQGPLRFQGYLISALAFGRLFLANFTASAVAFGVSHRVITVVPIIAIFYTLVLRLNERENEARTTAREKHIPQLYSYGAAILLVVLARFELGRPLTVIAWAILGTIYLASGILWRNRDLRIQSYLIAILTAWRSWSTNFFLIGTVYGIPERLATTVPVIVLLLASHLLCRQSRQASPKPAEGRRGLAWLDANAQGLFSVLASLLLAVLLFYEVRGNLLTVAWTIEGLCLTAAGFLLRERTLRLSGLGLFAVCLFKVFVIDLAGLETIYRILSFIVLGIILLIVSFGYTKHKDVLKRYI